MYIIRSVNNADPVEIVHGQTTESLNAVATKSQDGKTLYVKTVNPGQTPAAVSLTLTDGFTPVTATMQIVAPGSLDARNTLERPHTVRAEPGRVDFDNGAMRFALPPQAAAVITINL